MSHAQQSQKMTREQFGQIIKARRLELGLTLKQVSAMVGGKMHYTDISRLERSYGPRFGSNKVVPVGRVLGLKFTSGFLVVNRICTLPVGVTHGRPHTYTLGCRCTPCCRATHQGRVSRQASKPREIPPLDDPRHGTSMYVYELGCRCEKCQILRSARGSKNKGRRLHYETYYKTAQSIEEEQSSD